MTHVILNVAVGNETQSVELTAQEWSQVKSGGCLRKEVRGFYEGEELTYTWLFNDLSYPDCSLVVLYEDGEGYLGSIQEAWTS